MIEHAAILELGELGAHRRRGGLDQPGLHERLRPDGLARRDVRLDDETQQELLSRRERSAGVVAHSVISLEMTSFATIRPRRVRVRVPASTTVSPSDASRSTSARSRPSRTGRDLDRLVEA